MSNLNDNELESKQQKARRISRLNQPIDSYI